MRELLYLSDTKLTMLLAANPKRGWRAERAEGRVTVGGLSLKLGAARSNDEQDVASRLDQAIDLIERSKRASRWFTDPTVQPGHWIQFELSVRYGTWDHGNAGCVSPGRHPNAENLALVIGEVAVVEIGQKRALRLVLCGSVEHMRDRAVTTAERVGGHYSTCEPFRVIWHSLKQQNDAWTGTLRRTQQAEIVLPSDLIGYVDRFYGQQWLGRTLAHVYYICNREMDLSTSTRVSGHARVLATPAALNTDVRYLLATPLYVEFVD